MNLVELRHSFMVDYKFESQKRGTKQIEVNDQVIAGWISEGQQDISNRIKPTKVYEDLSIVKGTNDYSLDSSFGEPIRAESAGDDIKIVTLNDMQTTGTLIAGELTQCAIWWDSANTEYKLKVNPVSSAVTLRLWFYVDTGLYSPSGSASQDWGTITLGILSGEIKIPQKFVTVLKFYLLGKCFNDYQAKYETEIRRLQGSVADSTNEAFSYNLGL